MNIRTITSTQTRKIAFVLLVLAISVYLRLNGLRWGTDGSYASNYHPDESVSMVGMRQIDLLHGRIEAPAAYFEGTFNYYLWALPIAGAQLIGYPVVPADDHSYRHILLWARLITVLLDELTIVIVFLAAYEATASFSGAIVAALFYSIIPIEVIYAHFMRPHVLTNTLSAAVLWLSIRLIKRRLWKSPGHLMLIGILSGLTAATRYTLAIVTLLPCLLLLSHQLANRGWRSGWGAILKSFIIFACWLTLGFVVGLFLGEPMLFLQPQAVWKGIVDTTLRFVAPHAFTSSGLFDLSPFLRYLTFLIPYGMFPLLWILPCLAMLYLCFCPSKYPLTIPLLLFLLIYLYPMSKGYSSAAYARATMPIFPPLAVLIAIALAKVRFGRRAALSFCLTFILAVVMVPSILFDWVYTRAMRHRDVRSIVRDDLWRMIGDGSARIGIADSGVYFYTVLPAVRPLKSSRIPVTLQTADVPGDYYLCGFQGARQPGEIEEKIKTVEATGNYKLLKLYDKRPHAFLGPLDLSSFPSDMTYPFPAIALFRKNVNIHK
jgi:hypothetical protein